MGRPRKANAAFAEGEHVFGYGLDDVHPGLPGSAFVVTVDEARVRAGGVPKLVQLAYAAGRPVTCSVLEDSPRYRYAVAAVEGAQ